MFQSKLESTAYLNRKHYYLILFFFTSMIYSQKGLLIETKNCKSDVEVNYYEYQVFRNDTLVGKYYNSKLIDSLQEGNYHIVYNTFYGFEKTDIFNLKENWFDEPIILCVDKMNDTIKKNLSKKLFFDKIKEDEEINIKIHFAGCFKEGYDEIVFFRSKKGFFVKYKNKKRKVKESQMGILIDFETEIKSFKPINLISTGNTSYIIKYGNQIFEFNDVSGIWNGFDFLVKSLKL
jgi:hypothetical protein